jgi:hypothetical protein
MSEVQIIRLIKRMVEKTKKKHSITAAGLLGELLDLTASERQRLVNL